MTTLDLTCPHEGCTATTDCDVDPCYVTVDGELHEEPQEFECPKGHRFTAGLTLIALADEEDEEEYASDA